MTIALPWSPAAPPAGCSGCSGAGIGQLVQRFGGFCVLPRRPKTAARSILRITLIDLIDRGDAIALGDHACQLGLQHLRALLPGEIDIRLQIGIDLDPGTG